MKKKATVYLKWLRPGLGIKRWLLLLLAGVIIIGLGVAQIIVDVYREQDLPDFLYLVFLRPLPVWARLLVGALIGGGLIAISIYELNRSILAPYTSTQNRPVIEAIYQYNLRKRGAKLVAIGGGTGLPSVLRGMKRHTDNLVAIVTVADNGGSSGRLRHDMGMLPPGDLRNNIAALADDEDLMTQLFQYRFSAGSLGGHSLGNLFISALADITGSMEQALIEAGRVLAIQGNVFPATLDNVNLMGEVRYPDRPGIHAITGEEQLTNAGGHIERVFLNPQTTRAYPRSVQAILAADLIVIGPGSLFTSILPSLLVSGITEAIRASNAQCIYICNVATQQGETSGFNVADHIEALERHVGRNLFDIVLANDNFPTENAGDNTHYVLPVPEGHTVMQRYAIHYADLTDYQHPWRHDPAKLARALQKYFTSYQADLMQGAA